MEARILFCEKIATEVKNVDTLLQRINEILTNANSILLTKSDIDALQNISADLNPFKITENCRVYRTLNKGTRKVIRKIERQILKGKLTKEKEEEIKKMIETYKKTHECYNVELSKYSNSGNPYGEKIFLKTGYYCSRQDYLALELQFARKSDPSDVRAVCKKLSLFVNKQNYFIQKNEYSIYFMLKLNNDNNNGKNGKNSK